MTSDIKPFPQANDFNKIVLILNIPQEKQLVDYAFLKSYLPGVKTDRQVDYYLSAAKYLGLINQNKRFTEIGNSLREKTGADQLVNLVGIILNIKVFSDVYYSYLIKKEFPAHKEIENKIREEQPGYSDSTYFRRTKTVESWVRWIIEKSAV